MIPTWLTVNLVNLKLVLFVDGSMLDTRSKMINFFSSPHRMSRCLTWLYQTFNIISDLIVAFCRLLFVI